MEKKKSRVTVAKVFRTFIWPRRGLLLIGLILIAISRLSGLVLPWASKYLVEAVIANKNMELLKMLLAGVVGAIIVQAITSFALTQLLSVEAQRLISILRARVQQLFLRLPIRFFHHHNPGPLVSRIMT